MQTPESLQDGICQIREANAKQDAAYVSGFMVELVKRLGENGIDISEESVKDIEIAAMTVGMWADCSED